MLLGVSSIRLFSRVVRVRARREHSGAISRGDASFTQRMDIDGDAGTIGGRAARVRLGRSDPLNDLSSGHDSDASRTSLRIERSDRPPRVLVVAARRPYQGHRLLHDGVQARRGTLGDVAIPNRQLIPTFLYPGRLRVGSVTTRLDYNSEVKVLDGVDWFWIQNLIRVARSLKAWKPEVRRLLEWWTGTMESTRSLSPLHSWRGFSGRPSSSSFMRYRQQRAADPARAAVGRRGDPRAADVTSDWHPGFHHPLGGR